MSNPTSALTNLDDPQTYHMLDQSGMGERIAGMPSQAKQAWLAARSVSLPKAYHQVERVVLVGMGGSATGGDILVDLAAMEMETPTISICRDYNLPPGVGTKTLVIASSYSGNTEETLSAFEEAVRLDAKVVAMTSGGKLAQRCQDLDIPTFAVTYKGEPRSALGYSFVVPLAILSTLGLLQDQSHALEESVAKMAQQTQAYAPTVPLAQNPAKALAQEMYDRLVVVYGTGVLTGVARRWKNQINENAKAWAFYEALPELNHNAIVGYENPATNQTPFVVLLKPAMLHPRTALRFDITADILREANVPHRIISAKWDSPMTQILSTTCLGDYASYYLAMLYGVDPSPVPPIDHLKHRLAGNK